MRDSAFRAVLPRSDGPSGEEVLGHHLRQLYDRLGDIAFDRKGLQTAKNLRRGYGLKRGDYHLPDTAAPSGGDEQTAGA